MSGEPGGTARPASTSVLHTRMQQQAAEEQARAVRLLLAVPLLTADQDPAGFDLVRRHAEALRRWFDDTCGWALHVEPRRGYARLAKVRDDPDPSRPARRRRSTRAPFDRRRYVLLCLVAAELARPGVMTTIGLLAERVRAASVTDPGIEAFDTASREQRSAFVDAVKLLEDLGIVHAVDGVSDAYLESADAKVLYQVDEGRLARLLTAPAPPSQAGEGAADLTRLLREPRYGNAPDGGEDVPEQQRNRWLRHSITRRVLDDPVVYLDELTAPQRAYLASLTGRRVVREAAAAAGFVLEERAEGVMAVDPDGIATDTRFPDDHSHAKHAALLLLELLGGPAPVTVHKVERHVAALLDRFPSWGRAYQSEGGAARLTADALGLLRSFGLATRDGDTVAPRPAAARYAAPAPADLSVATGTGAARASGADPTLDPEAPGARA